MRTIRFLRKFVSMERVTFRGPDLALRADEKRELVVQDEYSTFEAGEVIEVQPLTVGDRQLMVVGSLEQRLCAVLDDAVAGEDYEEVK